MEHLFAYNAEHIKQVLINAPIIYVLVIVYVKIFGIRTTSSLNSFDWIVTVAMGSLVASTVVLKSVPIYSGAVAILALIVFQYGVTKLMYYSKRWKKWIRTTPQLLLLNGKFIDKNLKKTRVIRSEVLSAIRENGLPNINNVYAVVLETNATISVIGMDKSNTSFSLADVQGLPDGLKDDLKKAEESGEFPEI